MICYNRIQLREHKRRIEDKYIRNHLRVLDRQQRDHAGPVDSMLVKCLQIGLQARSARRVGPSNRQSDGGHSSGSTIDH